MTSNQRIEAFAALGKHLLEKDNNLQSLIENSRYQNPWFIPEYVNTAVLAIAESLTIPKLSEWLSHYNIETFPTAQTTVGLTLAGNIPLVGFHDVLCCLISGFSIQVKLSSDDKLLIPYLLNKLQDIEPAFIPKIQFVERLKKFDKIIATGSNNTSRYFEYYFKNVPHIIRKNRNGIAVLSGKESNAELTALGHDIFDYFGLGCRNVSKIYFPKNYHYPTFFEAIESFFAIGDHYKYHNNYDYNKAIYLVNGDKHLDNGFLLLKEDTRIASPLAVVFSEEYDDLNELQNILQERQHEIQCISSNLTFEKTSPIFPFGQNQRPGLSDYADGVDVLDFLVGRHRD